MGLIDFVKSAGAMIFGGSDEPKAVGKSPEEVKQAAEAAMAAGERGTWGDMSCVPPEPVTAQVMKTSRFMASGMQQAPFWFAFHRNHSAISGPAQGRGRAAYRRVDHDPPYLQ